MAHVIVERHFDNPVLSEKQASRASRLGPCLEQCGARLLRALRSSDGRTLVCEFEAADAESVLATIALGIGANVAVFSLANWVMLRPVPGISDQGRLVVVEFRDSEKGAAQTVSYPNLTDLAAGSSGLAGLAGATTPIPAAIYWDGGEPRYLSVTYTSSNFFGVLGTRLTAGRPSSRDEEIAAPSSPVAVISDRLRREAFGDGGTVVGRALWLTGLFRGKVMPGLGAIEEIHVDWRVLVFTGMVALVTGVVSGLGPAIAALRADTIVGIKAGAGGVSRSGGLLRGVLGMGQLALSLSLMATAFLLVRTVHNLRAVDVGFDADSVTTFTINPALSGYSRDASLAVIRESLRRVQAIPGVEEAAVSPVAPFMATVGGRAKAGEAAQSDTGIAATSAWVSAEYFRALGIPLLAGRAFEESEEFFSMGKRTLPVAILSRTLARRLFGSADPMGRTVATAFPGPPARVIGVVADSRWGSLMSKGLGPMQYYPIPDLVVMSGATFIVRSSLPPSVLHAAVQRAVNEVAPSTPLFDVMRLRQRIDQTMTEQRLLARLLSAFGLLAVLLATVGLYSVIAFSVTERTKELAIRIALGARSEQILAMVVRRGALFGVGGVAVGVVGTLALSRLVTSQLFGVSALEPSIYIFSAVLLLGLVLIASLIPARQATRLDPVSTLRVE